MSILDAATNQALNAVIDLHAREIRQSNDDGPYAVCGHCSWIPGALPVPFPCETIKAMTVAAEMTRPKERS